jgi:hypothetical protein
VAASEGVDGPPVDVQAEEAGNCASPGGIDLVPYFPPGKETPVADTAPNKVADVADGTGSWRISTDKLLSSGAGANEYGELPSPPPSWPGKFYFNYFSSSGIVWWRTPNSTPYDQQFWVKYDVRNRTKSIFLRHPSAPGRWLLDRVLNWSGHEIASVVYDSNGLVTKRRYGRGLEERVIAHNYVSYSVERYVYPDGDYQNDAEARLLGTIKHNFGYAAGVLRLISVEGDPHSYLPDPSGANALYEELTARGIHIINFGTSTAQPTTEATSTLSASAPLASATQPGL